jgi:hypothetical protein
LTSEPFQKVFIEFGPSGTWQKRAGDIDEGVAGSSPVAPANSRSPKTEKCNAYEVALLFVRSDPDQRLQRWFFGQQFNAQSDFKKCILCYT